MKTDSEVLIVGGGPAGLGAAMALGRLRRSALVCDDFRPRNLAAEHMHNFPGEEGLPPLDWRKKARRDVEQYDTVRFFEGTVTSASKSDGGFDATLSGGRSIRKIILACGILDPLPPIPGLQELWGKSAFHCPFCHGYEHRDRSLALIGDGPPALNLLAMLRGLTSRIVLLTNGKSRLEAGDRAALGRRDIRIIEHPIERVVHDGGRLKGIVVGGEQIDREVLVVANQVPFQMKCPIGDRLGCEKLENGLYKVGEGNRTSVPGVYAAGDNMTMQQTVLGAVGAGQAAGIAAVKDLSMEALLV